MNNIDYIINLCLEISHRGKTPSVALVRKQAQRPLAIPDVIKGLQRWKSAPNQPKKSVTQIANNSITETTSLEERVTALENQLRLMAQKIDELTKVQGN